MSEELTTFDIKILEQIQQDAALSTSELAEMSVANPAAPEAASGKRADHSDGDA